ncbi:uncharacterized protein LOC110464223 [Mizuhopecten yessoensis]|uniref:Cyclic GMP-AMP synthase n=1 Tax=Mizuhopecten yessoensis TaxID=6573 RepID=A0A210PUE7_MIZYE|nr:uncharacterized protein LOC110464223 [Mizuhopecten yessoensis]OWF40108.1 Cyclic GMP-AMP synthase [Mizuhopecten yessoensis]
MSDQGELYEKSWILYHILNRCIGNRETVAARRRSVVVTEQLQNAEGRIRDFFLTGSRAEGLSARGSDNDWMLIDRNAVVLCPDQDISNHLDIANKTVCMMRKARSRPGYVNLELLHQVQFDPSIVPIGDSQFISSEIYRQTHTDIAIRILQLDAEGHGPAVKIKHEYSDKPSEMDIVFSFPCYDWPSEANEWMNRPRLHDWPDKKLRDQIVQGGCHLVPEGDKTSAADQSLQWRISFTTAERKLFHSLTHVQFLVYGLIKKYLKQISGTLDHMLDETDIMSSYIIKTSILYAVESTSESFWQEKHTFLCFMFCLKILINWVKAGHCPNYFIKNNNMFLGKVHGQNQQKLLRYLTALHDMNWNCLSVGTAGIELTIGEHIRRVRKGELEFVLPPPTCSELKRDEALLSSAVFRFISVSPDIISSLELLAASKSDIDEFMGYCATGQSLSCEGMKIFGEHTNARGNKEKYKSLRKCKNLLRPFSTMFTSPGLLGLATYYYQTGNYMKTLEMCDHMTSSSKIYLDGIIDIMNDWDRYEQRYCGRGYNLLHKCQAFVTNMTFAHHTLQFCPSQLQQVITSKREMIPPHLLQFCPPQVKQVLKYVHDNIPLSVPPLPYAVFLSFLCYHELGDTRRRDTALIHLQTVKYVVRQGVGEHWIVHNILGICYETVGDTHRALREYRESLRVRSMSQCLNPAKELIERLQHVH